MLNYVFVQKYCKDNIALKLGYQFKFIVYLMNCQNLWERKNDDTIFRKQQILTQDPLAKLDNFERINEASSGRAVPSSGLAGLAI